MLSVVPAAAGHTATVSGSCKGDDGTADAFDSEGADVAAGGGSPDLIDAVDTAQALGNFAEETDPSSPTNACEDSNSWLGAHAAGTWVVCYDGSVTVVDQAVTGDGPNECGQADGHHDGQGGGSSSLTSDGD